MALKINNTFDTSRGPSWNWSSANGEVASYKSVELLNEAWTGARGKSLVCSGSLAGFEFVVVDHKNPLGRVREGAHITLSWYFLRLSEEEILKWSLRVSFDKFEFQDISNYSLLIL